MDLPASCSDQLGKKLLEFSFFSIFIFLFFCFLVYILFLVYLFIIEVIVVIVEDILGYPDYQWGICC